jgi:hypothetical protein
MRAEPKRRPYPLRKLPVGAAGHFREQLDALAGGHGKVLRHDEKAWASITFEGARHTIELQFLGGEAVSAGEAFVAALPDHEFAVPGQLVADATVTKVEHVLLPEERMTVEIEALLLKDA